MSNSQRSIQMHRRVAGVDYLVDSFAGAMVSTSAAIEDRFAVHDAVGGNAIHVDLVADRMPDLSAWQTLVTARPSWCILRNGTRRCMCLGQPDAPSPAGLIACWQGDASHATVHCGPGYSSVGPAGTEVRYAAGYPVDHVLLMYYLASRQGLLVHAAGVVVDGRALVFPGISGGGKTTIIRQFLARDCPDLLSDERVVVREMDGGHVAFGTPWPSDAGVAVNASAPLVAILFPAKGAHTQITALSPEDALDRLLPATSMLWHEDELVARQLETCEGLLSAVPAFELSWSPSVAIVDELQDFVRRL